MNKTGKLAAILVALLLILCSCGNNEGIDQHNSLTTDDKDQAFSSVSIELPNVDDIKDAYSLQKYAESHSEFYDYLWENFTIFSGAEQANKATDLKIEHDPADNAQGDGSQSAEGASDIASTSAEGIESVENDENSKNVEDKKAQNAVLQAKDVYFDKTEGKIALVSYLKSKNGSEWMDAQSLIWAKERWSNETKQKHFQDYLNTEDGQHFEKKLKQQYTRPVIIGCAIIVVIHWIVIGILVKLLIDCQNKLKGIVEKEPEDTPKENSGTSRIKQMLSESNVNPNNFDADLHSIPEANSLESIANSKSYETRRSERPDPGRYRKTVPPQNRTKPQGKPSLDSETITYWSVSQNSKEEKQNHIEYYTLHLEKKAPLKENIQICPYYSNEKGKLQLNSAFCQEQGLMESNNLRAWTFMMGSIVQINEVFDLYDQNGHPITKASQANGMQLIPEKCKLAEIDSRTGTITQKGKIVLKKGGRQR